MKNRFKWKYLVAAIVLAITIFVASLAIFPDWKESKGWILSLVVIAIGVAVQFFANWRQAFEDTSTNAPNVQNQTTALTTSTSANIEIDQRKHDDSITTGNITDSTGVAIGTGAHVTITDGQDKKS